MVTWGEVEGEGRHGVRWLEFEGGGVRLGKVEGGVMRWGEVVGGK